MLAQPQGHHTVHRHRVADNAVALSVLVRPGRVDLRPVAALLALDLVFLHQEDVEAVVGGLGILLDYDVAPLGSSGLLANRSEEMKGRAAPRQQRRRLERAERPKHRGGVQRTCARRRGPKVPR